MTRRAKYLAPMALALCCMAPAVMAADGSDAGFNREMGQLAGLDTGSGWFDYYVATVNQDIALRYAAEPYGAAGPNGPIGGFDGYLAGFILPDTGSGWFNAYVDDLSQDLLAKGY